MPHSTAYTMSHCASGVIFTAWLAVGAPTSASANVITDWDEKAIAVVFPTGPVPVSQQVYTAQRMMGMVHVAMLTRSIRLSGATDRISCSCPLTQPPRRKPPQRRRPLRYWRQLMKRRRAK